MAARRAVSESNAFYSHDHGFFLTGPDWTVETLRARRNEPVLLSLDPASVDPAELVRLADALEALASTTIHSVVSGCPPGWPVTDDEVEALTVVVDQRRAPVAARLRALSA